ncbi:MAG: metallophosphoesterase [Phycisphaeraceae bacterium]
MPFAYGLLDPVELSLPRLPAALDGLRVAHISDLHVRRPTRLFDRLANQLTSVRLDLIVLTGDYMEDPGHEPAAIDVLARILAGTRPRLGAFGVFGNHDTWDLRQRAAALPVTWLNDARVALADGQIELAGGLTSSADRPDSVGLILTRPQRVASPAPGVTPPDTAPARPAAREADVAANDAPAGDEAAPLRVLLTHFPSHVFTAADLGYHLLLAGHTHGGQCRLPTGHPLTNSTDLPLRATSGVLRHRDTLAGVSRGVGHAGHIPRVFCRPHVPVYTLRRRTMPGIHAPLIDNLHRW